MALKFEPPPDWLVQQYVNRPDPVTQGLQGANEIMQMYAKQKQQEEQKAFQEKQFASQEASRKATQFGAIAPYVPEAQIPNVATQYGIHIPSAQPSGSPAMPMGSPAEEVAQQSLPSEHQPGSSLIDRWNAAQSAPGGGGPTNKPTSKYGREQYAKDLQAQKLEKDLANDPNAPVPTITPEQALAAGNVNPRAKIIDTSKDERGDRNRDDRLTRDVLRYAQDVESHPVIKELNKQQIGLNQVRQMVDLAKQGNTVSSSAMGTKMAKAMGEVGALTEPDISRYVQSGRLDRKTADILSKWTKGVPTDATLSEIQQITSVLNDSYSTNVQPIYNRYIERFARNHKISNEDAAYQLNFPYQAVGVNGVPPGQAAGAPATPAKSFINPGEEAEYAEFKRSMGGK